MEIRTDLALERREMKGGGKLCGVEVTEYANADAKTTVIDVRTSEGARALGKPEGKYITVEMDGFPDSTSLCDGRLDAVIEALKELVPPEGEILAAGLGNADITPDALGPQFASMVLATRHLGEDAQRELGLPKLRKVSVIAPSVTGKTGLDAAEIIAGVAEKIRPAAIVTADALAARSVTRLARTVQLSNTGIEPGSGVGNKRKGINGKELGVPVIALGVPTVVDALSIACDVLGERDISKETAERFSSMTVTPKDTDLLTARAAKLLALALNCVLQPSLTREEIVSLM